MPTGNWFVSRQISSHANRNDAMSAPPNMACSLLLYNWGRSRQNQVGVDEPIFYVAWPAGFRLGLDDRCTPLRELSIGHDSERSGRWPAADADDPWLEVIDDGDET